MYPGFPDVLRAIRQNLIDQLMPELQTDYAREQAGGVLLLIEHLLSRWDRALDVLREEHADLRATLERITGAGGPSAAAAPGNVLPAAQAVDQGGRSLRGEDLVAATHEMRARLAAVISDAPDGSAALRLAEEFIARQLVREEAAVVVGALSWD